MGRVREESQKRREERESQKKAGQKRENHKKEDAGARKDRKVEFFHWFAAPEGQKVGSLKRWVPSHLARWEMEVKMLKNIICAGHF